MPSVVPTHEELWGLVKRIERCEDAIDHIRDELREMRDRLNSRRILPTTPEQERIES